MLGLVIKSPWIDLILAGHKTWEIRGSQTNKRERIVLIKSRSGTVFGTCRIVDCLGPLSPEQMRANMDKHQVPLQRIERGLGYPQTYAWVLADARPLAKPVPYQHRSGAVIWVRLNEQNTGEEFERLKAALQE